MFDRYKPTIFDTILRGSRPPPRKGAWCGPSPGLHENYRKLNGNGHPFKWALSLAEGLA
jgi:hypothetical protein